AARPPLWRADPAIPDIYTPSLHDALPSSLDQPRHDLPIQLLGERVQPVNDEGRTSTIGLHDNAKAIPAGERRIGQNAFDHVEREIGRAHVELQSRENLVRRLLLETKKERR